MNPPGRRRVGEVYQLESGEFEITASPGEKIQHGKFAELIGQGDSVLVRSLPEEIDLNKASEILRIGPGTIKKFLSLSRHGQPLMRHRQAKPRGGFFLELQSVLEHRKATEEPGGTEYWAQVSPQPGKGS